MFLFCVCFLLFGEGMCGGCDVVNHSVRPSPGEKGGKEKRKGKTKRTSLSGERDEIVAFIRTTAEVQQ